MNATRTSPALRKTLLTAVSVIFMAAKSAQAEVQEFRLHQDRLWLEARNEPLPQLLERFAAAGVAVEMDPLVQKAVSGSFRNSDAEKALAELLHPYSYLLDWQRSAAPGGEVLRLTGIRVFREGHADALQPLARSRRIETSFDGRTRFMAREILIGFAPGSSIEDLNRFLARTGGTVIDANAELGIYRILLPEGTNIQDLIAQTGRDGGIALAEPNYIMDAPDQQKPLPPSAYRNLFGDPSAPAEGRISVAVLDTGLAPDDRLSRAVIGAYDATRPGQPLEADTVGHGTLMAQLASGLISPYDTPAQGGVPIVAVKAFADDGMADAFTLMNAMTYAVQNSSGPVSLSWGSETPSRLIDAAVQYVVSQGRPVFAAVGNENTGRPMYPAACPGVVGVAASGGNGLADYSNRGGFVGIIAPGSAGGAQGTSVATAYVAHIAAQYMQKNPGVTAAETVAALKKAAGPDLFLTEEAVRKLLSP